MSDSGVTMHNVPIFCDNTSAINITKNLVQHSRTKYIEIRHHFIRDHALKGDICIEYVDILNQLADIFTKSLNENQFCKIRRELGMIDVNDVWTLMSNELLYMINIYDVWKYMFDYAFLAIFGAFMHFWVKWFESPRMWFESLFQNDFRLKNHFKRFKSLF